MLESVPIIVEHDPDQTKQFFARKSRLILTAIKCTVSGVLMYWILRDSNLGEIFMAMESANTPMLVLAFSLTFVGPYVSAHRWRVLLKAQSVDATISFLIKSCLVGVFFNNFLPSTIGGDAVRAYDSWRVGKSKVGAVVVIFLDRLLGIVALMLFALGALVLSKDLTANLAFPQVWMLVGLGGVLLVVFIIFMPPQQLFAFIPRIKMPFLRRLHSILDTVSHALLAFQDRKDMLVRALGLSLILQANVVIHYYLIAKALDFPVPLHNFFLIIPLAIVVMMIPVSINAIGIRENAFVFLFATFGVSTAEAIALAWLAYGFVILQGLIGGMVYGLRR